MIQPKRMTPEQIAEVTARHEFFKVGDVDAVWCIRLLAHSAALEHDLGNAQQRCLALEHAAEVLAAENAEARADILRQAARIAALESENAVLQRELDRLRSQVVAALSSAGPEVGEDERTT